VLQDTIPTGPIAAANPFRILEANLSYHALGHEFSIGKNDHWLGPGQGTALAWSNNAEDIYDFEINRIEPLRIPLLSSVLGPIRYDFFVGSLKGHTYPNHPWVHVEKVSFKPTRNLELGFERTVIWGGLGHEPVTLHTFFHSFFSFQNVSGTEKFSTNDPGARFGSFDFNYRLPFLRKWVTLYSDSLVHDDVSPIDAPRRAAVEPGIYLSHFPGRQHLDFRVEADSTDPVSNHVQSGQFFLFETVQRQGPTNKGFLFGPWIGRQNKGGQAWLTYHLSPSENVQFMYRRDKASKAFIPDGSTQDDYMGSVTKHFFKDKDIEVKAYVQYEDWLIPFYKPGRQNDTTGAAQITWYPKDHKLF
jgi:Capsule assembly protein Wzi